MSREDRLAELLERWEDAPTQGNSVTPENFCHDCPDLLDDFRKILGQLGPINAVLVGNGIGNIPADEFTPDIDAGRYKPISFHARGGLGMVFLAEDGEVGRSVALKCMQRMAATDSGSRRRFLAEAEITGRLEHPGIVPVYGLGQDANGKPFYAMRFIRGETLGDAVDRFHQSASIDASERNVELRRLLRHFIAVCETMAYAHSRGVIHRDLKPANIMIGPYGETLVVDWGLAKQIGSTDESLACASGSKDSDDSVFGRAKGTPAYMSPEQARGEWDHVGPASDIYSLGSTLFVLLTGKRPYEGRNVREVIDMVKLGTFFAPRTANPAVPKALDAICRKAMAFRAEERYADARDLAKDLERCLADEPVTAYREPFEVRARRWLKQHRTLVVSVAAALIVGMSALGALAVQQQRNNWALQDKNDKLRDKNDELRVKNDELIATQLDLAVVANKGGMLLMDSIQDSESTQFLHRIRMLMQFVVVRAFFEHSLATAAKLTEKYPGDPKYRFNYAMTQRNLGIPLQWLQLESEAVALLEYSRDAFVKLANEHSESPVFAYESERSLYALANGYTTLGATRFDAYQPRDVTEWFAKAQPILDDLLLRNAENKQWKELNERNLFIWCLVLRQLAVEEFGTKDYAKGLALFERALPIARKQHATNTKNKDWPVLRRNLLLGTGLMCKDRLGQLDRAKPTERKEMIRIANLGIEVFNEANPVDFAPQVRELANIREELSK